MIVYFIVLAVLLGFFTFGLVALHKFNYFPKRKLEIVFGVFILLCYVFVLFEAISNSSMTNHFVTILLPHNNIVCFIYIIGSLFFLVPDKFKVKKYLMLSLLIMSPIILCNIANITIEYYKVYKSFSVKYMWYVIGLLLLIYLGRVNLLRNNIEVNYKHFFICLGSVLVIYGIVTLINLTVGLNIFGIGAYFFDFIKYTSRIGLLIDFGSVILSSLVTFGCINLVTLIKKKKINQKR